MPMHGERAPDFTVQDARGETLQLLAVGSPVVLLFLRYLGCSICRDTMAQLTENYLAIASRGVDIWVIVPSHTTLVQEYYKKNHPPFRMISNEDRSIYKRYGIEEDQFLLETVQNLSFAQLANATKTVLQRGHGLPEGTERQKIGAFVVDSEGIIRYQYTAKSILEEISVEMIIQAIDTLPQRRIMGNI